MAVQTVDIFTGIIKSFCCDISERIQAQTGLMDGDPINKGPYLWRQMFELYSLFLF